MERICHENCIYCGRLKFHVIKIESTVVEMFTIALIAFFVQNIG